LSQLKSESSTEQPAGASVAARGGDDGSSARRS